MRRVFSRVVPLLGLLAIAVSSASLLSAQGSEPIFVKAGHLIDGRGGAPMSPSMVRIEEGRVVAVGPSLPVPAGARIIDLGSATLLPGLIDLHTHLTDKPGIHWEDVLVTSTPADAALWGARNARVTLEAGFTTCREMGATWPYTDVALRNAIDEGAVPGPRLMVSGAYVSSTGGGGDARQFSIFVDVPMVRNLADSPAEVIKAVRTNFKNGADFIKIASHFSEAEIRAAVEEAHALGLRVTVDAETFYIGWAVEAGVDSVEHPLPRTDEVIQMMADKRVHSVPTLIPYSYIFDLSGGYFGSTSRRFSFSNEANLDVLRRMRKAGIKMGVGTDLVMNWFRYLPTAYIRELEFFVQGGYSKSEALIAATRDGAEILGMNDKLGTLEPGKLADVLVVKGNPDEDLRALASVELVFRDGYLVVEGGRLYVPRHAPLAEPTPGGNREWR